jgi:hypothetical protein
MNLETRSTDELIRMADSGDSFAVAATGRTAEDLVRVARAASRKQAKVTLSNLSHLSTDDLIRIGAVGNGCVVFQS